MIDIAIGARSSVTGRFNFVKDPITGDVSFDETQAHALMTTVAEQKGSWWANPDHGSELYKLTNITSKTATQATAAAADAVEHRLQKPGLIGDFEVDADIDTSTGIGILALDVTWTLPNGQQRTQRATL